MWNFEIANNRFPLNTFRPLFRVLINMYVLLLLLRNVKTLGVNFPPFPVGLGLKYVYKLLPAYSNMTTPWQWTNYI